MSAIRIEDIEDKFDYEVKYFYTSTDLPNPNIPWAYKFVFFTKYSLWSYRYYTKGPHPCVVLKDHVLKLLENAGREDVDWELISERDDSFTIAFKDIGKASVLKLLLR